VQFCVSRPDYLGLVEHSEIVALQYLVGKLGERDAVLAFHPGSHAIPREHGRDPEVLAWLDVGVPIWLKKESASISL
jgi:hypothetical protein